MLLFRLNGVILNQGFAIMGYGFDTFNPQFFVSQDKSNESVLIRSIRIEYQGNQILRPQHFGWEQKSQLAPGFCIKRTVRRLRFHPCPMSS